jgi:sec-independent protein translocase protein TatC
MSGRPGEAGLRCRQQGFRPRDWPWQPASPRRPAASGDFPSSPYTGWFTSMPNDQDLFSEEQSMATMSFGEHIEELRVRLILALIGLFVGVFVVFIPPLDIGYRVMKKMEEPAKQALDVFYREEYAKKAKQAELEKEKSPELQAVVDAGTFVTELKRIAPKLELPEGETLQGQKLNFPVQFFASGMIDVVRRSTVQIDQSLVSLAPLETLTIFFMVCMVSGLVLASPWVFYQIWTFVGAGLYRHERKYVKKYLPFSLGLFLAGVFLCFFFVLPITLTFLLQFNVWLGVAPTLRLSDWMGFATILPLIFGVSFQTPLVMLFLERIHVFTIDDFRAKRKMAILIITISAAVLTPGQDPFSMLLLAIPMVLLYELGIVMIGRSQPTASYDA